MGKTYLVLDWETHRKFKVVLHCYIHTRGFAGALDRIGVLFFNEYPYNPTSEDFTQFINKEYEKVLEKDRITNFQRRVDSPLDNQQTSPVPWERIRGR
ncbi:MAG: hypothetical protein AAB638_03820 [Patescibacteria group bacterium]